RYVLPVDAPRRPVGRLEAEVRASLVRVLGEAAVGRPEPARTPPDRSLECPEAAGHVVAGRAAGERLVPDVLEAVEAELVPTRQRLARQRVVAHELLADDEEGG